MTRTWLAVPNRSVLATLVVLGSTVSCNTQRLAHSGDDPIYPLRGLHTQVACEECHGTDGFFQLPNTCVACHEIDRPTPDHYPDQPCDSCHVEDGWGVVDTVPTVPVTETGTATGFDHAILPEDQLCWGACHEADRPSPDHYKDETKPQAQWWDCSGCHTPDGWKPSIVHPARIPHGSSTGSTCAPVKDEASWNTGCVGCHPNGTATFTCYGCHAGVHPDANYLEAVCLTCHEAAEPTECDP